MFEGLNLVIFVIGWFFAGALSFRLATWLVPKDPPPKGVLYLFVITGYVSLTAAIIYALILLIIKIVMFFVGTLKFIAGVK